MRPMVKTLMVSGFSFITVGLPHLSLGLWKKIFKDDNQNGFNYDFCYEKRFYTESLS